MLILGNKQQVNARSFRDDNDFWRVRELLVETYQISLPCFNWEIRRWDGFRFYEKNPDLNPGWRDSIHLWETVDGKLVGAAHPEGKDDAHLELHPDFRHIEEEMIYWTQENLAGPLHGKQKCFLRIFASEHDSFRPRLLEKLGYEKTDSFEVQRKLHFGSKFIPQSTIPGGYMLHTIDPDSPEDCRRIADLLNAAFHRDFHTAEEYTVFSKNAPCFHRDLDLVAKAPDGSFAAFVGIADVAENRYGVFEPVCTHPDQLRKGLARALMLEGIRRLKGLGANEVWVGTGGQIAANRLYESVGFTEAYKKYIWNKIIRF
jgi:mycothiol synthase